MQFKSKKFLSLTASIAMAMSTVAIPTFSYSEKVMAAKRITSIRLSGNDRFETAVKISQKGWETSDYAIIATGENFPDALCAAPLAKKYNAPILLTRTSCLNSYTTQELARLKVKKVIIVGGNAAVSANTEQQIKDMHISTERAAGADRYETSRKIAERLGKTNQIAIATGENFPDALSISSIAATKGIPILLTQEDRLPDVIESYLKNSTFDKSYVIGGEDVISNNVASEINNSVRLSGSNRYDTNVAVLNYFKNDLKVANTFLATGQNFPDALTASALAPLTSSPLLLVCNNTADSTRSYVNDNYSAIKNLTVIGGEKAIPDALVDCVINNFGKSEPYVKVKEGNSIGNINNLGLAVVQNDVLYSASSNPNCIVRMNLDGSAKKVLCNDKAFCLNVSNDYIFYLKYIDNYTTRIYRMDLDGSNRICLNNQDSPSSLMFKNDCLYYINDSDGGRPYKMNIDGTGRTRILSNLADINSKYLNITENYIYYSKSDLFNRLYRISLDGANKTPLCNDSCSFVIVDKDYIYYINESHGRQLYRIKTDGSENIALSNDPCGSLNFANDVLYYTNQNDNNKVYAIKTDGTGKTKVLNQSCAHIIIVNNSIYPVPSN